MWSTGFEPGDATALDIPTDAQPVPPGRTVEGARCGKVAGRYEIPAGGSRSESVVPRLELRERTDLWFAFSTRLEAPFPLQTHAWQVLAQWKNEGPGSPPLALVVQDGRFVLTGGYGWPGTNSPGQPRTSSATLGTSDSAWHDWVVHILFSSNPGTGRVDMWMDRRKVLSAWHPRGGTLYPRRTSYVKFGYYRASDLMQDAVVLHDAWSVSRTPPEGLGGG